MSNESCVKIKIIKEVPFFGEGDTIQNRLRKVSLKGFPDVKIYENAEIKEEFLTPEQIKEEISTPQPTVYQSHLDRVESLYNLFKEQDIDLLNLSCAYDFIATSSDGVETEWTILPPVVESFSIPKNEKGGFDYSPLIGDELKKSLDAQELLVNPEVSDMSNYKDEYNLINDGSHRMHYGYLNGGLKVLKIKGFKNGYPYYAAPQPYSSVTIYPSREKGPTKETKIHVVEAPGHKMLYRLFPSGGIKTGDVRSPKN